MKNREPRRAYILLPDMSRMPTLIPSRHLAGEFLFNGEENVLAVVFKD